MEKERTPCGSAGRQRALTHTHRLDGVNFWNKIIPLKGGGLLKNSWVRLVHGHAHTHTCTQKRHTHICMYTKMQKYWDRGVRRPPPCLLTVSPTETTANIIHLSLLVLCVLPVSCGSSVSVSEALRAPQVSGCTEGNSPPPTLNSHQVSPRRTEVAQAIKRCSFQEDRYSSVMSCLRALQGQGKLWESQQDSSCRLPSFLCVSEASLYLAFRAVSALQLPYMGVSLIPHYTSDTLWVFDLRVS